MKKGRLSKEEVRWLLREVLEEFADDLKLAKPARPVRTRIVSDFSHSCAKSFTCPGSSDRELAGFAVTLCHSLSRHGTGSHATSRCDLGLHCGKRGAADPSVCLRARLSIPKNSPRAGECRKPGCVTRFVVAPRIVSRTFVLANTYALSGTAPI